MKKIAFVVPSLANTGPIIVVRDLCEGLLAKGFICKVFYFDEILELEMPCSTEHVSFFSKFDFYQWDIIHSHLLRSDIWIWLRRPWFSKGETKYITTLHNPITYKAFRTFFNRRHSVMGSISWTIALTRIDKIVVLNSETQQNLPWFLKRKSGVIYNGRKIIGQKKISDEKHSISIAKLREQYRIVGSVCGMFHRKGIEQIIKTLVLLPQYGFIGVGDGPQLEEWKELAISLNVNDRCYWTGYTPNAIEYYSSFDVFALPSRSEGFPLALIEAAAHGLPIVLSDIPIHRSIIEENRVALFAALDQIGNFACTIEKAYKNKDFYGKSARQYYEKKLTVESMIENYCKLYE